MAESTTQSLFDEDEPAEEIEGTCARCGRGTRHQLSDGTWAHSVCAEDWRRHAGRFDGDTSAAAAKASPHRRNLLRELALAEITRTPSTVDEIAARHPEVHLPTLSRRVTDLRDAGRVRDAGERRKTRRGSSAVVWEVMAR